MKLLIADDSAYLRKSLIRLISTLKGIQIVGEASDVQEAIEKTKSLNPDILILDLKIPGGSGFDVLKAIRNDERNLTVIVLTNYISQQFRRKSFDEGADFFFDKSTEFDKVLDVIRDLGCVQK